MSVAELTEEKATMGPTGLGLPDTYCSPILACPLFGVQVLADMVFHQCVRSTVFRPLRPCAMYSLTGSRRTWWRWADRYVPAVFPYCSAVVKYGHHHVEHHFLSLRPLGAAFERPPDGNERNGVELDSRLGAYNPQNEVWRWFTGEVAKFEGGHPADITSAARRRVAPAVPT